MLRDCAMTFQKLSWDLRNKMKSSCSPSSDCVYAFKQMQTILSLLFFDYSIAQSSYTDSHMVKSSRPMLKIAESQGKTSRPEDVEATIQSQSYEIFQTLQAK